MDPQAPLTELSGIGPVRAEELRRAGLECVDDLLACRPLRWENRARLPGVQALVAAPEGTRGTLLVEVENVRLVRTRRRGFTLVQARLSDGDAQLDVVWYNQPYLARQLDAGRRLFVHGELRRDRDGAPRMENPEIEMIPRMSDDGALHTEGIVPVYRRIGGLSSRVLRGLLHRTLQESGGWPDPLPEDLRLAHGFPRRGEALAALHFPGDDEILPDLEDGRAAPLRRMAYEELLLLFLTFEERRRERETAGGVEPPGEPDLQPLVDGLPFDLGEHQARALEAIASRLSQAAPMAVLLQGDVGCGKTVVALLAARLVMQQGGQVALLAPTEVLARQHERSARRLLAGLPTEDIALLTAGQPAAERRAVRQRLAAGSLPLVIGTHTLIQDGTTFAHLRMTIVDEQQRFGVEQRVRLARKGDIPHLLAMTATPVPRTLALTMHGDLDLLEIRQRLPGRVDVRTEVRSRSGLAEVWSRVREHAERGEQIYIVFPRIDPGEKSGVESLKEAHRRLAAGALSGLRLQALHGGQSQEEKERALAALAAGEIDVLLSTTVVEVGVDVARATLMVVLGAERFGLAQLHQLRGRVGRGNAAGTCILVHEEGLSGPARERLAVLEQTHDGFVVAEADLQQRGAGDLGGTRQHGEPLLRFADLARDGDLVEGARKDAARLAEDGVPDDLWQAARRRWQRAQALAAGS